MRQIQTTVTLYTVEEIYKAGGAAWSNLRGPALEVLYSEQEAEAVRSVRDYLDAEGQPDLHLEWSDYRGRLTLTGYIRTTEEDQAYQYLLGEPVSERVQVPLDEREYIGRVYRGFTDDETYYTTLVERLLGLEEQAETLYESTRDLYEYLSSRQVNDAVLDYYLTVSEGEPIYLCDGTEYREYSTL